MSALYAALSETSKPGLVDLCLRLYDDRSTLLARCLAVVDAHESLALDSAIDRDTLKDALIAVFKEVADGR